MANSGWQEASEKFGEQPNKVVPTSPEMSQRGKGVRGGEQCQWEASEHGSSLDEAEQAVGSTNRETFFCIILLVMIDAYVLHSNTIVDEEA